jgi:hypothetical protein
MQIEAFCSKIRLQNQTPEVKKQVLENDPLLIIYYKILT